MDNATPPTRPRAVYLYATCVIDQFAPQAGLDTVRLLEREGLRVEFPADQTCCGQPAWSSGQPDEARAVARRQLALFPEPWPVVVPSGSCAAMIRNDYPALFADDAVLGPKARELAARTWELSEFLVEVLGFDRADLGPACSVALHTSCSARRGTRALDATRRLLARLDRVSLVVQDHESECCGFGGTFSLRHPDIAGAMVADKVAALKGCGAENVVSGDCGCLLNILGHADKVGAGLPGEHLASFLWRRTAGAQAASGEARDVPAAAQPAEARK